MNSGCVCDVIGLDSTEVYTQFAKYLYNKTERNKIMIAQYKTKGDRLTIIGFLLVLGSRFTIWGSASDLMLVLRLVLILVGTVLFVVGCGFLAKAKGHHGTWGVLGLLNIIGYLILLTCLRDRSGKLPTVK